jgi:hypothetical protein
MDIKHPQHATGRKLSIAWAIRARRSRNQPLEQTIDLDLQQVEKFLAISSTTIRLQ